MILPFPTVDNLFRPGILPEGVGAEALRKMATALLPAHIGLIGRRAKNFTLPISPGFHKGDGVGGERPLLPFLQDG